MRTKGGNKGTVALASAGQSYYTHISAGIGHAALVGTGIGLANLDDICTQISQLAHQILITTLDIDDLFNGGDAFCAKTVAAPARRSQAATGAPLSLLTP